MKSDDISRGPVMLGRLLAEDGVRDTAAVEWFIEGLRNWRDLGDGSIAQWLHLPSTARQVRLYERDAWLREAAAHLPGDNVHARAKALQQACRRFERRHAMPDRGPDPVTDALEMAYATDVLMPSTVKGFVWVLREADLQKHFPKSRAA